MRAVCFSPCRCLASASPALAQQAAPPPPEAYQLPPELTDLRWADRLTDAMVAMSKAFLNLPVGEIEAAVEGRPVDVRRPAPDAVAAAKPTCPSAISREQIEATRPAMQAGMRAVAAALAGDDEGPDRRQPRARASDRQPALVPIIRRR